MSELVFLALGSNLGTREQNLRDAIAAIGKLADTRVEKIAQTVETDAVLDPENQAPQPKYLNTVIQVATAQSPLQLLEAVKKIEHALGRIEAPRWSARVIDIDILLYGNQVISLPTLTIPHERLHLRDFVLGPLSELVPELEHPVLHTSIQRLRAAVLRGSP